MWFFRKFKLNVKQIKVAVADEVFIKTKIGTFKNKIIIIHD